MKPFLFIVGLFAASVAHAGSLGDLEVLNDMGKRGKQTGIVLRSFDSSCKVLSGHSCEHTNIQPAPINRTYGEIKQLPDYVRSRSVPHFLQQLQRISR